MGPSPASGPLNGATSAKISVDCALAPDPLLPHADSAAASATAATTPIGRRRRRIRSRWLLLDCDGTVADATAPEGWYMSVTSVPAGAREMRALEPGWRLVSWPPPPAGQVALFCDHPVADRADAFDSYLDQIARLQPDGWLPGEADPARRARRDDVAGPEPRE